MGSLPEVPELTHLERIGPKGYLRYVFPFQLDDGYDIDHVSRVLKSGFDAAKSRLPAMDCEAVPDEHCKQAGVLRLKRIPSGQVEPIVVKDLRGQGRFPMTYAELKSKSFPVAAFEGDDICRRSVWTVAGERLPVSLVQANFIDGGLVLSWCILHLAGDGTSFFTWSQIWAEECRRAQGLEIAEPVELSEEMFADRTRFMGPSGHTAGRLEDHPEYIVLPFTPKSPPPKMLSNAHRGQVFYFSPSSLAALKAEATPSNASDASISWISTNDALSALLWRTVMAIQNPVESLGEADPVSSFAIAIDGRLRTDPPVHPRTMGCFLGYVAVEMPIRKMLTCELPEIALEIRRSISRADENWTDDIVTLADGLEDVDRLVVKAFTDVPGFNCVQTSWINFKLYDLNWGKALGDRIQAVRSPGVGVINGLQVILPALPDGGIEVLVGVEKTCLEKLLVEPLWNKFALAR